MEISRNASSFVILGRSKERSDAAQTPGSMPRHQNSRCGAEFRSVALLGRGNGMDPRAIPGKV
ncbi:hypothetical protein EB815_02555 [Mesorhizobium loti]|nr:hypothetical protein EB815_02555 [Mesorhizobium loti]